MGFWEKEVGNITLKQVTQNAIYATVLLVIGILLGKVVEILLKKFIKKMRLEKTRGYSFIEMFIVVIKWAVYILFLNFALLQLGIPEFTNWLTSILVVIPSLSGALILITVGFAIATYLKLVIEDSKIDGWEILSQIFYFFTMYVFLVFAFKTALYSLDSMTTNILVVVLSTIVVAGYVFWKVRKR